MIKNITDKSEITVDLINQIINTLNDCNIMLEFELDVENDTPDITDDEYITIKKDGVFVGGKTNTQYNGQNIFNNGDTLENFVSCDALMESEHGVGIDEIHCLQSSTELDKDCEPVVDSNGVYSWCRFKFTDGKLSPWLPYEEFPNAAECASFCADYCIRLCKEQSGFRATVYAAAYDL